MKRHQTAVTEGQTFAGTTLASRYASFVKLPHTLFALPFAGVGVILATYSPLYAFSFMNLFWILIAFTSARFAAMGFNRIADRAHDAKNPRTAMRELPAGKLTLAQAWLAVIVASALFIAAAFALNRLCGLLSPVALAWVFFYSYTKRFTSFSHYVLGLSLAIAPVGAYLAIAGEWSQPWYALVVLAAAVMFWVSGFDVVYAIQDIDYDRSVGLNSMPARLGVKRALLLARVMHVLAVAAFVTILFFGLFPVGLIYAVGVGFMSGLLFYEHRIMRGVKDEYVHDHVHVHVYEGGLDLQKIDRAFFKMNVLVSTSFFVFTLADRILHL